MCLGGYSFMMCHGSFMQLGGYSTQSQRVCGLEGIVLCISLCTGVPGETGC